MNVAQRFVAGYDVPYSKVRDGLFTPSPANMEDPAVLRNLSEPDAGKILYGSFKFASASTNTHRKHFAALIASFTESKTWIAFADSPRPRPPDTFPSTMIHDPQELIRRFNGDEAVWRSFEEKRRLRRLLGSPSSFSEEVLDTLDWSEAQREARPARAVGRWIDP